MIKETVKYHKYQKSLKYWKFEGFKSLFYKQNGVKNMSNLRESALEYKPIETKVISDLKKVSTSLDVYEKTFKEGEKDEFTVKLVKVDDEEYRVPNTVLKQLKVQLEEKPEMEFFKVKKQGEGLKTEYTVIGL